MHHPPLSQGLADVLKAGSEDGHLTVNELLARTGGRGLYLVLIILSLPFITPVSIPGLSNLLGLVIVVLSVRLALGMPPGLPRFIGARHLPHRVLEKLVKGSVRLLRFVEWGIKPRGSEWMTWRAARFGNAWLLAVLGLLLALPIPPVVPLSNTLPSYAIILIAASMMEEDGLMIWLGYAMAAATLGYLWFVAHAVLGFFLNHYDRLLKVWWFP
ncbi:MAG: exopolysaccharide biosynthesis protein [Limisphaerales bacterium]